MYTVQLNSNLTLAYVSLAETQPILSTLACWMRVHKCASDNLWQTTLVRHAKLHQITQVESHCVNYQVTLQVTYS